MQQLYAPWILRHSMPQCPKQCQELRKLFAVLWRAPVTVDVNISTTYHQSSQTRVNSTTTDPPTSTSCQTVNITTCTSKVSYVKICALMIYGTELIVSPFVSSPLDVSPPRRFAPWTFRPLDVSLPGRFDPKTFRPWTFRQHAMDDSPP